MLYHLKLITLVCLFPVLLCACGSPSRGNTDIPSQSTHDSQSSQTALAILLEATSTPSLKPTLTPTPLPTNTPTFTPEPSATPTITPTPAPPTISAANAGQLSLLDKLNGFRNVIAIRFSSDGVTAIRDAQEKSSAPELEQTQVSTMDYLHSSWYFASPSFSPDGNMLVYQAKSDKGYYLSVYEIKDHLFPASMVENLSGYSLDGSYYHWSDDGQYLSDITMLQSSVFVPAKDLKCSPDCEITQWFDPIRGGIYQLPGGSQLTGININAVDRRYFGSEISPDNSYLATVYNRLNSPENLYVQLWKMEDGEIYRALDPVSWKSKQGENPGLEFSPNGNVLAFIGGGKLNAWDWQANRFPWTAEGIFSDLDYSPDGSLLATGAPDGSLQIWNAENGNSIATLTGHSAAITAVGFSPDGSLLASLDEDGELRLWGIR